MLLSVKNEPLVRVMCFICASLIVIATIHPPLSFQASHNRLYNDWLCEVRLAHISSQNVTQHQQKQRPQNGDLPPPSSQQPPWELAWMNPRLLCSSAILLTCRATGYFALSLYSHIQAINHWVLWAFLECLLSCQMIIYKSKQGPNLISVQHISVLSPMKRR